MTPLKVAEGRVAEEEHIKTHVKRLDELLGGGLIKRASTLIVGPSGTGKTLLALTIASENALRGLKVHYATFEEPAAQVITTLKLLGYDPEELMGRGLTIASVPVYQAPSGLAYIGRSLRGGLAGT